VHSRSRFDDDILDIDTIHVALGAPEVGVNGKVRGLLSDHYPASNLNACTAAFCCLAFHCHAHKRLQLNATLSQLNPVNILTTCFFEPHYRGRSDDECLALYLLTLRIWWFPNNASKGQMGFSSAFKGLKYVLAAVVVSSRSSVSVYQCENRWMNVNEIWHWGTLLKFVETSQLRSKSKQENFIWMPRLPSSPYQREVNYQYGTKHREEKSIL